MVYPSCTGITGNSLMYNACAVVRSTLFLLGCLWQCPKKKKKTSEQRVCRKKRKTADV